MKMENVKISKTLWVYLAIFLVVCLWSAINAYGTTLWILEALPCLIGIAILAFTYKRFQFTNITYFFILIHFIILLVGAHYTYARVPAFDWLSEIFGWSRNNYDKLGHFAQGFIPAMIAREVLIRLDVLKKRSWLPFIVVSICLAISAFYELFEWWTAVIIKQSADDFLGMQGYEWDTQSDMFCAMIGAITMLILLSKVQDKQIAKIKA
jgi:Predicted membrane protein